MRYALTALSLTLLALSPQLFADNTYALQKLESLAQGKLISPNDPLPDRIKVILSNHYQDVVKYDGHFAFRRDALLAEISHLPTSERARLRADFDPLLTGLREIALAPSLSDEILKKYQTLRSPSLKELLPYREAFKNFLRERSFDLDRYALSPHTWNLLNSMSNVLIEAGDLTYADRLLEKLERIEPGDGIKRKRGFIKTQLEQTPAENEVELIFNDSGIYLKMNAKVIRLPEDRNEVASAFLLRTTSMEISIFLFESVSALARVLKIDPTDGELYEEFSFSFTAKQNEGLRALLQAPEQVEVSARLLPALQANDKNTRYNAALALGFFGDSHIIKDIKKDLMMISVDAENGSVRERAGWALKESEYFYTVEAFAFALQDRNVEVRKVAASALFELRDPRAKEALITALKTDADASVRFSAIIALDRFRDPRLIEVLISALRDPDASVRTFARAALENLGSHSVAPLIALLEDADPRVRTATAMTLEAIGDPAALPPLEERLKIEPDQNIRAHILETIKNLQRVKK